jgi:hypothetical protein
MAYYKITIRQVGTAEAVIKAKNVGEARHITECLIEAQRLASVIEQEWDDEVIIAIDTPPNITVPEHAQACENAEAFDEIKAEV